MINWHHQTSKIWPQSYRIPEFHSEGWEMLNYRNHNLTGSNVGHMLKRIAGLPDTETQETFPLLRGVLRCTWISSDHNNKFQVAAF